MELAQSKFPDLTQGEEELEALEKHREELELIAEDLAVELNLPSGLSQMLFHYSLNNGTFSFICEKKLARFGVFLWRKRIGLAA